ncbi:MAG: capsular polysaccharide biosynthesis protein [Firmicutes bacterium]|nr:capsular polysaccharide biosynthesis protein [Bacillota bacterium]MBQ9060299.1 capsular polysaccharide biosynthesis protein [Bacillota bacterium]
MYNKDMIVERAEHIVDFHTHVLPGIDDGSRDLTETRGLLQEESQQNVDCVIATPHFYADRFSVEEFLKRRQRALQSVLDDSKITAVGRPSLCVGAEVYFFPGMGRAEKLRSLCIEGTDVILIEMPFVQWTEDVLREVREVISRQKLQVVLAHVERYPQFQKDQRIWRQVMDLPLTIQMNGGSFIKDRRRRRMCLQLLREHERALLGSDCHNLSSRVPNLEEARRVIAKKLGDGVLERIDQIARELLKGATEMMLEQDDETS